jgi:hypothetical protein
LADVAVRVGAPIVVLLPLTQEIVPPVANAVEFNGCELPPVTPPVQPLIVVVPLADPLIVVQVILLAAPA